MKNNCSKLLIARYELHLSFIRFFHVEKCQLTQEAGALELTMLSLEELEKGGYTLDCYLARDLNQYSCFDFSFGSTKHTTLHMIATIIDRSTSASATSSSFILLACIYTNTCFLQKQRQRQRETTRSIGFDRPAVRWRAV